MDYDKARHTLEEHRKNAAWLQEAEAMLVKEPAPMEMVGERYLIRGGFVFTMLVPYEVWHPEMTKQVEKIRTELAEMDRTLRSYLDTTKPTAQTPV